MHRFLLVALTAGLSLPISSCGHKEERSSVNPPVVVETLASSSESWSGDVFSYPKGKAQMTLQKVIAQPGFKTPLHFHPQPGIAYVVSGNLSCGTIDGKKLQIGPGDSFATNQDSVHYCEIVSKKQAILFVAYAGVVGKPLTIQFKK